MNMEKETKPGIKETFIPLMHYGDLICSGLWEAKAFFIALASLTGWPFLQWWAGQLEHVKWNGFHFYDMIFPLFLFIGGHLLSFFHGKEIPWN